MKLNNKIDNEIIDANIVKVNTAIFEHSFHLYHSIVNPNRI